MSRNAITVQPPLSRRGKGPGLVIIIPSIPDDQRVENKTLDPEPLYKWAEEGFNVAQIQVCQGGTLTEEELNYACRMLDEHPDCRPSGGPYGQITYTLSKTRSNQLPEDDNIVCWAHVIAQVCDPEPEKPPPILMLKQMATPGPIAPSDETGIFKTYYYPNVKSKYFIFPSHRDYDPAAAAVAHTRTLEFLKKELGGPYFDLEAIWEEHTKFEFEARSVEETMNTMVAEPYVNHIPTMTGGIGRRDLTTFYAMHFIFSNPEDTEMQLISRTVGIDRVVDEFIFSFTHDRVIDWLAPGVPPTGKKLRIPFTAVVNIRGDRLYHERISWDQLTVLIQMGLMPEYLPFPYALPEGSRLSSAKNLPFPYALPEGSRLSSAKNLEYRVPGAGHEVPDKLVDESSVPSNQLIVMEGDRFAVREV